jgi:hypothetical protein
MTDNEIIKALECCKKDDCDNCPNDFGNCYANLAGYALDLINRQKAEIERLKDFVADRKTCAFCKHKDKKPYQKPCRFCEGYDLYEQSITEKEIKAEAVKEFAQKVDDMLWQIKIKYIHDGRPELGSACEIAHIRIEKLLKETVGGT